MRATSFSRFLSILLLIMLILSGMLNYVFFNQAHWYYLQLSDLHLDPLGLSYYPTSVDQQTLAEAGKPRVVFFGDSRATSWPVPTGFKQYKFINRGIGNQTSAQVLQRFDNHIKPLQPQLVIVQVGINDLKTIPLFPERKEAIVANCKANIQQIVNRSVELGAKVILTTIFPVGRVPLERRLFWSSDVVQAVTEVNTYLYSLAGPNIIVLDAYSILASNGVTREEYAQDLLHLNTTGYEALNLELVEVLNRDVLSGPGGSFEKKQ